MEPANSSKSNAKPTETKYERIRKIGVGSYGVVFKCVNRQTGQTVAIKRYSENDSDPIIRKIAMREVRMLRQLKHTNLIHLIEVFRRKRILHLVFEYCDLTVLDVIEKYGNNCPANLIKKIIWQLVNGVNHCHSHNCIHRDIKPENILINHAGIVKLCDFGFARNIYTPNGTASSGSRPPNPALRQREAQYIGVPLAQQAASPTSGDQPHQSNASISDKENRDLANDRQALTEYVATRWYRAPELLVGDIHYDIKIDIWAIGCVTAELMRGEPLWPGKTDLDQLCLIKNSLGPLTANQTHNLMTRALYEPVKIERALSQREATDPLDRKFSKRLEPLGLEFVLGCLQMDPEKRPTCDVLLEHKYIDSPEMHQFVRGVRHIGHASAQVQSVETGPRLAARNVAADQPSALANASATSPQKVMKQQSNSQAILRAANSQQPASKRLVLGHAVREVGADESSSNGSSNAKYGANALIAKPVRARQFAPGGGSDQNDGQNYVPQSRHKRKTQPPPMQTPSRQQAAERRDVSPGKSRLPVVMGAARPTEPSPSKRIESNVQTPRRHAKEAEPPPSPVQVGDRLAQVRWLPAAQRRGAETMALFRESLAQEPAKQSRDRQDAREFENDLEPPLKMFDQLTYKDIAKRNGIKSKRTFKVANKSASTNSTMSTVSSTNSLGNLRNKSTANLFLPPVVRRV